MCCFAQPVKSVSQTEIFARFASPGSQYLVYRMQYESLTPNAMILPLPVAQPAAESTVRFISLKDYPTFFNDLNRGFPFPPPPNLSLPLKAAVPTSRAADLKVHEVGDFVASFVPSVMTSSASIHASSFAKKSGTKSPTTTITALPSFS